MKRIISALTGLCMFAAFLCGPAAITSYALDTRGVRGEAPQIPPPEIRRSRISDLISVSLEYLYEYI